jgi:hypothetical protein
MAHSTRKPSLTWDWMITMSLLWCKCVGILHYLHTSTVKTQHHGPPDNTKKQQFGPPEATKNAALKSAKKTNTIILNQSPPNSVGGTSEQPY